MKRVLSILTIALVLFCSMPLENVFATSVADIPQIENINNASAAALYETIKRLGYRFIDIPGQVTDNFMTVMQPLVDNIVSNGEYLEDAFYWLGDKLYYSIDKVVSWVNSIFGSDDVGQYSPLPSGVTIEKNLYNAKLSARVPSFSTYGQIYGYPLMILDNVSLYNYYYGSSGYIGTSDNMYLIPCYYDNSNWFFFNRIVCGFQYTVNGSSYSFSLNSNSSSPFWLDDVQLGLYRRGLVLNSDYYSAVNYNNFLNYTVASAFDLDDAIRQYREYLDSHLINISYDIWLINNPSNHFRNTGIIYKIERPSGSSSEPTGYAPVNYDYVINNFNEGDTIYENNVVNNNTTNNNTNINPVFDIDFEDTFDFGLPDLLDNINDLPGYLTRSAIGIQNHVGGDSPGGGLMGTIFNGIPLEISTVLIACFVLLCVFGLLNRLLG